MDVDLTRVIVIKTCMANLHTDKENKFTTHKIKVWKVHAHKHVSRQSNLRPHFDHQNDPVIAACTMQILGFHRAAFAQPLTCLQATQQPSEILRNQDALSFSCLPHGVPFGLHPLFRKTTIHSNKKPPTCSPLTYYEQMAKFRICVESWTTPSQHTVTENGSFFQTTTTKLIIYEISSQTDALRAQIHCIPTACFFLVLLAKKNTGLTSTVVNFATVMSNI